MEGDIHVLPVNDLKPHDESRVCACRPKVEPEGDVAVVIHYSYDGREILEAAIDAAWECVN